MNTVPDAMRKAYTEAMGGLGFDLPHNLEAAKEHRIGDTLADFLVIEMFEGHRDGETLLDSMNRVVDKTQKDLDHFQSNLPAG